MAVRWLTRVSLPLMGVLVAAVTVGTGAVSHADRPATSDGAKVSQRLVATMMGNLRVSHPVSWRYLQQRRQPLGPRSGFGWLADEPVHKPCIFGANDMICRLPVASLSPGGVFVSAGALDHPAPPLRSSRQPFKFVPNRIVDGHLAELTEHAPGYSSACPEGTTTTLALIIEMVRAGSTPAAAAYYDGIWDLTACAADPDQTTQGALAHMFATVRLARTG